MSSTYGAETAAARYNRALGKARENRLPANFRSPQPTTAWPPENVILFERYRAWLKSGGISPAVVDLIHIPTAGHVLGLALKPHPQLNLDSDFSAVLDYVTAKGLSAAWLKNTRNSLEKFRKFLRHERGQQEVTFRPAGMPAFAKNWPAWLVEQLERYYQLRQRAWRPARLTAHGLRFWSTHRSVWGWLLERRTLASPADVRRQDLLDYINDQLTEGRAVSTINLMLRSFHAFLLFLQDQDFQIPRALLRVPCLKEPDRLPRFLTDNQVRLVRGSMEHVVTESNTPVLKRDALLMRAAFYLLWQAGLRLGEVEELRLEDLDLGGRKLLVRQGKGQKDRAVYLTETVVSAIQAYLPVRGEGASDHVFLYRHRAVQKDLIRCRLRAAGERVGVPVTPHRLRHTFGTQLLNAGCRVTSIQKLLGHRRLDTTLVYARVHDQTVSADYYAAMARIEARLDPSTPPSAGLPASPAEANDPVAIHPFTRAALLGLANRLADPELAQPARLALAEQLQTVLNGKVPEFTAL